MKTIIYFMRHGEVYNPQEVLYARLPGFCLSRGGRKCVNDVSRLFRTKEIDKIYSSPMLRARQTASIIGNALRLKVFISSLLIEVKHLYQGMPLSLYRKKFQPILYSSRNILKGQESSEEILRRMMRFVKIMEEKNQGKVIIAVSHGDPILILKAFLTGADFTWEYKRDNYLKTGDWFTLECEKGYYRCY